ncbi:MAG: glycosyltransferase [Firmicutes bacterium]|nr:glycosyltransferase [Bacillota bacterium]
MCPLLSIILPVYNCEAYIKESLFSVIDQLSPDYELIVIDDGSTDKSVEIIAKSCEHRKNVRFCLCEHKGASGARNIGLNMAKGKYIAFIDCDDCLFDGFLDSSRQLLKKNLDLYIFGIERIYLSGTCEQWTLPDREYPDTGEFADEYIRTRRSLIYSNCNKFYKRSIIEEAKLRFDEKSDFGEDRIFNYGYLALCKTIAASSLMMLKYIQRDRISMSTRHIPQYFEKAMKLHEKKIRCFLSLAKKASDKEKSDFAAYDLSREAEKAIDRFAEHEIEKAENLPLINRIVFGVTKDEIKAEDIDILVILGSRNCGYRIEQAYGIGSKKSDMLYLVSGGNRYPCTDFTEAEFMAKYLKEKNIPKKRIFIENFARNTRENLLLSSDIITKLENIETIGIVTAGFHIPRAKYLAKDIPLLCKKKTVFLPAYGADTSPENWFESKKGRKIILEELRKARLYKI